MPTPITFAVPAYNAAAYLRASVESILEGNLSPGDDIVIVNDASTDQTHAVIDELTAKHPAVRSVRHRYNKGSAAAGRNTAIESSDSPLIFCLDADNLLYPGSVPNLRDFLQEQKIDAAAFQRVDYFIDHPQSPHNRTTFAAGNITLADALAGHHWPGPNGNYLFTRDSWIKAGRYNENVGGVIDSWAFGIRQLATGSTLHTLPDTAYLHRYGHDSASVVGLRENNHSANALAALLPFLNLLEPESVDYMFDSANRNDWNYRLAERPLRVKDQTAAVNATGNVQLPYKISLMRKIRLRMARIVAG